MSKIKTTITIKINSPTSAIRFHKFTIDATVITTKQVHDSLLQPNKK